MPRKLTARLKQIAGIADVRIQQIMGQPTLLLASRRSFALRDRPDRVGYRRQRPGRSVGKRPDRTDLLARSVATASRIWSTSRHRRISCTSINDLETITVDKGDGNPTNVQPQTRRRSVHASRRPARRGSSRITTIMPVIDIYANVEGRDLGAVSNEVARRHQGHAIRPAARRHGHASTASRRPCIRPTPSCSPAWPCRSC